MARLIAITAALFAFCSSAHAQFGGTMGTIPMEPMPLMVACWDERGEQYMAYYCDETSYIGSDAGADFRVGQGVELDLRLPPKAVSPDSFAFEPDRATRRAAIEKMARLIEDQSPENAAIFRSPGVFDQIGAAIAPYGLSQNNLADSVSALFGEIHDAANGTFNEGDRARSEAMRQQVAVGLSAYLKPDADDPHAVQRLSDTMLLAAALFGSTAKACARADPALDCARIRQESIIVGKDVFGQDMTQLIIDADGIRPARQTPGGPAAPAAVPADASLGACGLPVQKPAQRTEQELYAKYGNCALLK